MPKDNAMTSAALGEIEERLFPEASRLRAELTEKLTELEEKAASNHLQSTARNLALHISSLIQNGRTDLDGLSDLIRLLTANAFTYRARKLRDYVGECSGGENETILATLFESLTRDADGQPVAFEVFRDTVEREAFGIVITAHPTFSISQRLTSILAELATVQMHAIQTSGNCIRNITADQYAGASADEIEDRDVMRVLVRVDPGNQLIISWRCPVHKQLAHSLPRASSSSATASAAL